MYGIASFAVMRSFSLAQPSTHTSRCCSYKCLRRIPVLVDGENLVTSMRWSTACICLQNTHSRFSVAFGPWDRRMPRCLWLSPIDPSLVAVGRLMAAHSAQHGESVDGGSGGARIAVAGQVRGFGSQILRMGVGAQNPPRCR
ncbi:hypothetical protein DFH06DRAFT_1190867 [Mycena polygramma]|nr:hypothetical protein DFH06DRAFT_1190867 [Mycena polygramma]